MSDKKALIPALPVLLNKAQQVFLGKKTPDQFKKDRPGPTGGTLTYVEVGYVINILNEAFGHNWDFEIENEQVGNEQVWVKGKLTIRMPSGTTITKMQYGGTDIKKYREQYQTKSGQWVKNPKGGQIISIADDLKAAASDCLKKCASLVGVAGDIFWPQLENWDRESNEYLDPDPDWIKNDKTG